MTRITFYWLGVFVAGGILLLASGESTVSAIAEQTSPSSSEHSILSTTSTSSINNNRTSSDNPPHTDSGPPLKSNGSEEEISNHIEDAFPENATSLEDVTEKAELQKEESKATALSEADNTTDDALSAEDQSSSDMYLSTSEANTAPVSGSYKPEVAEMEPDVSTTEHVKEDSRKEPSREGLIVKGTEDSKGMVEASTDSDVTNSTVEEQTEVETQTSDESSTETKSSPSSKSATKKRSVNGTVTTATPSDAPFPVSFSLPSPDSGSGSHSDDGEMPEPPLPEMYPTPNNGTGHKEMEATEFISSSSMLPTGTEVETERSDEDGMGSSNASESAMVSDPYEKEAAASEIVLFNSSGGAPRPIIVTPEKVLGVSTMLSGSTLIPVNEIGHAEDLGANGVTFDPDGMRNDGPQDPDSVVFSVPSHIPSSPLELSTFAKMSEHPLHPSESESSTYAERETNDKEVESGVVLGEGSNENIPITFGAAELPSVPPTFDPDSLSFIEHKPESQTFSHLLESQPLSHYQESQSTSHRPESEASSHLPESLLPNHQAESQSSSPQSHSKPSSQQTESEASRRSPKPASTLTESQSSTPLSESKPSSHQPSESQPSSSPPAEPKPTATHQPEDSQTSSSHLPESSSRESNRPTGGDQPPMLNDEAMLQDSPSSQNQSSDDTKVEAATTPASSSLMTIVHQPDQSVIRPVKIKLASPSTSVSPPILPTENHHQKTPELSSVSNLEGSNSSVVAGVAVKTSVSVSLPLSNTGNESAVPSAFEELLKNSSIVVVPGNPPTIMLKTDNDSASSTDTPTTTTEATTAGGVKIRKPKIKIPGVSNGDRPARPVYTPSFRRPSTTAGPPVAIFGKTRTRANSITSSTTARPFKPYSTIRVHYASHLPPGILPELIISTEPVTEPPPPTTTEEPISEVPFTDQTVTPTVSSEDDVTLIKVAGSIALDRGIRWNELLNNRHSPEFKEKSKTMHLHLERLFRSSPVAPHLWKIQIDGFSGSKKTRPVLVDFFLYLIKSPEEVPLDLLTTVLHEKLSPNNTFATYRVDTNRTSFERLSEERMVKTTPPPDMDDVEPPIPQWAIAVIVIGAASLIFIVLFAAVTMYGRHHMRRRYSSKLNEEDLERSSGEWESKMAAAYENMAADTIYDAEDLQSDTYKKHSRIATFHGIPSTLKRCDSWSSNGWTAPPKRKPPPHVH